MDFARLMAGWHPLLWAVPLLCGSAVAAMGSLLSRKWLAGLALAGIGWPLFQSLAAGVYLLWGPGTGSELLVTFRWMTQDALALEWSLDGTGLWAFAVTALVVLAAQVHALTAVAHFAGRHRFFGLMLIALASAGFLYTGRSQVPMLIGWEGLALSAAFMAGFWESEQRGERTGMRWLLFQRASGLLLLLGLNALAIDERLGVMLLVAAAAIRAGQVPFHGWLPDSAYAPAAAVSLLHGAGSTLAAVYLLTRHADQLARVAGMDQVLAIGGLIGLLLGVLAALQQPEPAKRLGWLFVGLSGAAMLGLAAGDPVAAQLLAGGQALILGGLTLAVGSLVGPEADAAAVLGGVGGWRSLRAYLVLGIVCCAPPSIQFVGIGRLFGALEPGGLGWVTRISLCLAGLAGGWTLQRVHRSLRQRAAAAPAGAAAGVGLDLAPAALAVAAVIVGICTLALHGLPAVGGSAGLGWAAVWAACGAGGALSGWLLGGRRVGLRVLRLTRAERAMERVADTGLGIGELVVQVPVVAVRVLGVVVWRVLGDAVIDTVALGTAVRTVSGVGIALRFLQNGRLQRYLLVALLAVVVIVMAMLR